MQVRRAKRYEINKINELLNIYGFKTIDASYINPRDVALIAVDGPKVVGFIWLGLMRQNKSAYVDCFMVHPDYAHKKVGQQLCMKSLELSNKIGVESVFGIIAHSKYHDKSAYNALRMAMGSDGQVYTQVKAQISHVLHELRGKL